MILVITMLCAWQITGDQSYKYPLTKSIEASYLKTDLEAKINEYTDIIKANHSTLAIVGPAAYSVLIKKSWSLTSKKLSLIPNTVSTYQYDLNSQTGRVGVTWTF